MSFYNFFRDLFGFGSQQPRPPNYGSEDKWQHSDEFRNPIWQTDEDDDDDNDFRFPGHGNPRSEHFSVFTDPFEITRYFENQMDNMLKNFFGFSHDSMISPFGMEDHFENSVPIEPPKQKSLRDEVLKPGYESPKSNNYESSGTEKLDADLDGKITSNELSEIWKDSSSLQSTDPYMNTAQRKPFSFHSFGRSISTQIIRKPDGTVEQRRTVRDSEGNEETTITQQTGDKTHTVVIKKDKDGNKTETETVNPFKSLEPYQQAPFLGITDDQQDSQNPLNRFPWHKFFGPNPKL